MIDNITGGRLITGFVRGVGAEYSVFGVNPVLSHERHYEAHDLVVQAWTKPGPFAFEGKHYHLEYVNVWPRPYQQPHPPIWCPSQGSNETIEWAAHPDRKYLYLQNFNPFSAALKYLNYYREVAQRTLRLRGDRRAARLRRAGLYRRHRRAGDERGARAASSSCSTRASRCRAACSFRRATRRPRRCARS